MSSTHREKAQHEAQAAVHSKQTLVEAEAAAREGIQQAKQSISEKTTAAFRSSDPSSSTASGIHSGSEGSLSSSALPKAAIETDPDSSSDPQSATAPFTSKLSSVALRAGEKVSGAAEAAVAKGRKRIEAASTALGSASAKAQTGVAVVSANAKDAAKNAKQSASHLAKAAKESASHAMQSAQQEAEAIENKVVHGVQSLITKDSSKPSARNETNAPNPPSDLSSARMEASRLRAEEQARNPSSLKETAAGYAATAKEKTSEALQAVKQSAGSALDSAKHSAVHAKDAVRHAAVQAKDTVVHAASKAKESVMHAADSVKHSIMPGDSAADVAKATRTAQTAEPQGPAAPHLLSPASERLHQESELSSGSSTDTGNPLDSAHKTVQQAKPVTRQE